MVDATRLERRLDKAVARATTPRGAAIVIATVSTVMTVGAGSVMTVFDHENYPSVGSGLWWAAQTVTTVGYGDDVPTTLAGRLVAVLVMLLGIGFLTVITAATKVAGGGSSAAVHDELATWAFSDHPAAVLRGRQERNPRARTQTRWPKPRGSNDGSTGRWLARPHHAAPPS